MAGLSAEEVAAWVEASCAAQGVPARVTDPEAVRRVGVLLRAGDRTGPQAELRPVRRLASQPPHGHDSGRVESVGRSAAVAPGVHDGVVEHGTDDRSLPVEVQSRPLGA